MAHAVYALRYEGAFQGCPDRRRWRYRADNAHGGCERLCDRQTERQTDSSNSHRPTSRPITVAPDTVIEKRETAAFSRKDVVSTFH